MLPHPLTITTMLIVFITRSPIPFHLPLDGSITLKLEVFTRIVSDRQDSSLSHRFVMRAEGGDTSKETWSRVESWFPHFCDVLPHWTIFGPADATTTTIPFFLQKNKISFFCEDFVDWRRQVHFPDLRSVSLSWETICRNLQNKKILQKKTKQNEKSVCCTRQPPSCWDRKWNCPRAWFVAWKTETEETEVRQKWTDFQAEFELSWEVWVLLHVP